jgi:SAM-dependent methyltransferase
MARRPEPARQTRHATLRQRTGHALTSAPFDAAARGYDAAFSDRLLGRLLRGLLHESLERWLPRQGQLVELGCGTGVDALWMAQRGAHVLATDVSEVMLAQTRDRAAAAGVALSLAQLSLAAPHDAVWADPAGAPTWPKRDESGLDAALTGSVDGVWSSFGPLNCVDDRRPLGDALRRWLRPGAHAVLVPMAPLCPWDWLWYGAQLRPRAALRRLQQRPVAQLPGGGELALSYPSLRRLDEELGAGLRRVETRALGALLPISEAAGLVDRAPRLFTALAAIEREVGHLRALTWLTDHVVVVYERQ